MYRPRAPRYLHSLPTRRSSDLGGLLGLRPDHHARGVAEQQERQVEGVAELHEARRLVRAVAVDGAGQVARDRKSTRLNSSHANNSYGVFCLKKKNITISVVSSC